VFSCKPEAAEKVLLIVLTDSKPGKTHRWLIRSLHGPVQKHVLPLVQQAKHTLTGDSGEPKGSPAAGAGEYRILNSSFC